MSHVFQRSQVPILSPQQTKAGNPRISGLFAWWNSRRSPWFSESVSATSCCDRSPSGPAAAGLPGDQLSLVRRGLRRRGRTGGVAAHHGREGRRDRGGAARLTMADDGRVSFFQSTATPAPITASPRRSAAMTQGRPPTGSPKASDIDGAVAALNSRGTPAASSKSMVRE
jgi:hypothetical protein